MSVLTAPVRIVLVDPESWMALIPMSEYGHHSIYYLLQLRTGERRQLGGYQRCRHSHTERLAPVKRRVMQPINHKCLSVWFLLGRGIGFGVSLRSAPVEVK